MARWSKDEIAMEILSLYGTGEALDHTSIARKEPSFLRAACRYFGSWRAAVEFAGLPYDEIRRTRAWTPERIVARIRELHAQGADLSWASISGHLDPPLAAAATRAGAFGSWRAALAAAGVDDDQVRRRRRWDEKRVCDAIRERARAGASLTARAVKAHQPALYAAGLRRFGEWAQAVRAAGVDADAIGKRE